MMYRPDEVPEAGSALPPGSRAPPPRMMGSAPTPPTGYHGSDPAKASDAKATSEEASTAASEDLSDVFDCLLAEAISWSDMRYAKQIRPCKGYAHCLDDLYMLDCFLTLAELPDIDSDSIKLLLRAMKLLRLCDYSMEDLCSILAHASAYFFDAYDLCGAHMDASEVGNVLTTLMFIAHCYVQDETCPLHVWHQHLFRKYCPIRTLNSAIIRLLEIRRYVLRLDSQDLSTRYSALYKCIQKAQAEEEEPVALKTTNKAILSKVSESI